ncbi:MAG: hypothetical protein AAF597_10580, partial [Bacteroidota bacterium]
KHVDFEQKVWGPVHQARIDAGVALGWVIAPIIMPWDASSDYHAIIVDVYKDLPTYLANRNPMPFFAQAHPGKDVEELLQQTDQVASRVRAEVRSVIDSTSR